jgi:hypothetical protein
MSAIFAVAALLPYHAVAANSWGTDFSDLWWNPNESGWGVNMAHEGEVIFMTLFVYGTGNQAKWYVGPAVSDQVGMVPTTFKGAIYETTGSALGSAFDPASVTRRAVGSATIEFLGVSDAILTYDVDGVVSTKQIQRQTFRTNSLDGYYIGATIGVASECGAANGNFARNSLFAVSHVGSAIRIESFSSGVTGCNFSGTYVQRGRMGSFAGPIACPDGKRGTIAAFEIEAGDLSFVARYTAHFDGGCSETGRMGGLKQD